MITHMPFYNNNNPFKANVKIVFFRTILTPEIGKLAADKVIIVLPDNYHPECATYRSLQHRIQR